MIKEPEDIQNRVRNHLCYFQTTIEILDALKNASRKNDTNRINSLVRYLEDTELMSNAQKQIDWFISLGAAMDNKIADTSFNIEEYINELS